MILLAVVLLLVVALVARFVALPRTVVREAAGDVVATVRRGAPYAYQYVLKGPCGRDVGDHDSDKLVIRADRLALGVLVRVAPVDRSGKRTGRSRLLRVARS